MKKDLLILSLIVIIILLFITNRGIIFDKKQSVKHLKDSIENIQKQKDVLVYQIDSLEKEETKVIEKIQNLSSSQIELKLNYIYPKGDSLITISKEAGKECLECIELLPLCNQKLSRERSISNLLRQELKINEQAYEIRLNNKDVEITKVNKKLKKNRLIKWAAIVLLGYKVTQDL